jgi:hypothetical protein
MSGAVCAPSRAPSRDLTVSDLFFVGHADLAELEQLRPGCVLVQLQFRHPVPPVWPQGVAIWISIKREAIDLARAEGRMPLLELKHGRAVVIRGVGADSLEPPPR